MLGHDTASKAVSTEPVGSGMVMIDQLVPFQWAISVLIKLLATAKQFVVLGHVTSDRLKPAGVGMVMIFQLVPFQCSIRLWKSVKPTAKQLVVLGHDTPNSSLLVEPVGSGLGVTDHAGVAPADGAAANTTPAIRATVTASVTNAGRRNRRREIGRLAWVPRSIAHPRSPGTLSGTIRPPTATVKGARDDDQTLSVGVHLKHNTRSLSPTETGN